MSLVNTIPWDTDLHFCHGWNLELWIRSFVYKYQLSKFPKKLYSCDVISLTSPLYCVTLPVHSVTLYILTDLGYLRVWVTEAATVYFLTPRSYVLCLAFIFHWHWLCEVTQQTISISLIPYGNQNVANESLVSQVFRNISLRTYSTDPSMVNMA